MLIFLIGCDKSNSPTPSAKKEFIVISCDTAGWIVPCGCTANQSGGILRRGTFLKQLRVDGDVIYADAGGAAAGSSPYQQAKFESILRGEKLMGISAHNLGQSELSFGPAKLREIESKTAIPFLSANAKDSSGALLADAVRIVPLAGKRIAFVGLVSPAFATDSIRIDDPRTALVAVESAHHGEYDSRDCAGILSRGRTAKIRRRPPQKSTPSSAAPPGNPSSPGSKARCCWGLPPTRESSWSE